MEMKFFVWFAFIDADIYHHLNQKKKRIEKISNSSCHSELCKRSIDRICFKINEKN